MAEADRWAPGKFDRDTAVRRTQQDGAASTFAVDVSPDWRAGRGPHGGYLAAMLMRALIEAVSEERRSPRSLTIHYLSAPDAGPALIHTAIERTGRSLSTLSARMEQDGRTTALVLAAFSVPWSGPELSNLPMPDVDPPDPGRRPGTLIEEGGPPFARLITLQQRFGGTPFGGPEQTMEVGGWLGLAEPRAIDALSLAFFTDALLPAPFMSTHEPNPAPTIDLTVHFRTALPRPGEADPLELCLARVRGGVIHEGFFEEDTVIWAHDGTVLAQSRQLALLLD